MPRDPGRILLAIALVAAALVYGPTLGTGITNYDDTWLIRDNVLLQHPSWHALHAIFFDLSSSARFGLTPEYLPVRDLSVMADFALWGHTYGGFHATSLLVYLAAIAVWYAALARFGVDRTVAGVAVLIWALHPSHAESVAWLSERKGLLGMLFAGACAFAYATYRAGGPARWLALAMAAGVAAVWSKAPAAFAVAALGGLELVFAERRASWRRSAIGLGAIGVVAAAAYVPVVMLALRWSVVGSSAALPASRAAMVLGVHGFYVRLGAMAVPNAVSYPIATAGPSALDIALGAVGLIAVVAGLVQRRDAAVRAGAVLWLFGWLPVSHLILPLKMIVVADRYLLIPSLGLALAAAAGLARIANARARVALTAAIALAGAARATDARASWRDATSLWERAVASNPADGAAWAAYLEALEQAGRTDLADAAVQRGLAAAGAASSPRLVMHEALALLRAGDRPAALAAMTDAAGSGEPRAMANLAVLLLQDGRVGEALVWARIATLAAPTYENAHRSRGKAALAAARPEEALAAFERAYALAPDELGNGFNVALALVELGRGAEARPLLEACLGDPQLGPRSRDVLAKLAK